MAGRMVAPRSTVQKISCPLDGSTAVTRGAMLYVDPSVAGGGVVRLATGSAEATTAPALFLATQTVASGATTVEAYLLTSGDVIEFDTASNTAANQLFKRDIMSTSLVTANTSSDVATLRACLTHIGNVGVAADRKALYVLDFCGQVTA